ncbi:diguanylate cyclase [Marinithermofilum abyssi]|uniref:Diguanylate cyclase n=1 Tax=Marinithermofilum abyssi TaxID=1571185 RepID=A0A8J2VJL7_9BACL|nr:dipeptidase [Marinithermofilum abyssi]GGE24792.1 diguanylate cyclase [Marinithermofilum abyssi]
MQWMDGHCDTLFKIWKYSLFKKQLSFYERGPLDVNFPTAKEAGLGLQVFALFVPDWIPRSQSWHLALTQVDLFYERIVQDGARVLPVLSKEDLFRVKETGKLGALLHLEGADALQGELSHLRLLHRLGVRQLGLTWNHANEAADGIEEDRNGGLTRFGRSVIEEMKRHQMILDVSHLSVKGFWEVTEADLPILASHSNCRALCPHIRNLEDDQIRALIRRNGIIGMNFLPKFVSEPAEKATIDKVLRHIEHICSLGGEKHVALGSDFDGIEDKIPGLENVADLHRLKEALIKRYPDHLVRGWMWENGYRFYQRNL